MVELRGKRDYIKNSERRTAFKTRVLFGGLVVLLILLGVILTIYTQTPKSEITPAGAEGENLAPSIASPPLTEDPLSISVPAPSIKLRSPKNVTYNTRTPKLYLIVAGSNLDTVLLSIDGRGNVSIPHDGTFATVDFARLGLLFFEDFNNASRWTQISGNWTVIDGTFFQSDDKQGLSAEAYAPINATDFVIEYKTRITGGGSEQSNFFFGDGSGSYALALVLSAKENRVRLYRTDTWQELNSESFPINPDRWHDVRVVVEGSSIKVYINDQLAINTAQDVSYTGRITLASWESQVYFDELQVYEPLADGVHRVTIYANNTADNSSSTTVYFTVNSTVETRVKEKPREITKESFKVELEAFDFFDEYKSNYLARVEISVKNLGEKEKSFRLTPNPVLLDDLGNQYEFVKLQDEREIKQTTIYPNVSRKGAIFFQSVTPEAKNVRIILYVNGERYEFHSALFK